MHGARGGDLFGFDARFDVAYACFESEDIFDKVHDLVSTPLQACRYECVHEECSMLEHSHVSPVCS